jgi:hypothetical protein
MSQAEPEDAPYVHGIRSGTPGFDGVFIPALAELRLLYWSTAAPAVAVSNLNLEIQSDNCRGSQVDPSELGNRGISLGSVGRLAAEAYSTQHRATDTVSATDCRAIIMTELVALNHLRVGLLQLKLR